MNLNVDKEVAALQRMAVPAPVVDRALAPAQVLAVVLDPEVAAVPGAREVVVSHHGCGSRV
jgi:hypothetical protein